MPEVGGIAEFNRAIEERMNYTKQPDWSPEGWSPDKIISYNQSLIKDLLGDWRSSDNSHSQFLLARIYRRLGCMHTEKGELSLASSAYRQAVSYFQEVEVDDLPSSKDREQYFRRMQLATGCLHRARGLLASHAYLSSSGPVSLGFLASAKEFFNSAKKCGVVISEEHEALLGSSVDEEKGFSDAIRSGCDDDRSLRGGIIGP